MASPYNLRKVAAANTLEHRVYIEKDGVPVSPFHDIPLYANQEQTILNMVVEIPRWTNAKLEVRFFCLPFDPPLSPLPRPLRSFVRSGSRRANIQRTLGVVLPRIPNRHTQASRDPH